MQIHTIGDDSLVHGAVAGICFAADGGER